MRRLEFNIENREQIFAFLKNANYGYLNMFDELYPYSIPMNYIFVDSKIVLHCAKNGKKIDLIKKNPNVSFNVSKGLSFIPSYYTDSKNACSATTFFKSIMIQARASFTVELDEKAKYLKEFMEKFQPERKYKNISLEEASYKAMLKSMNLIELEIIDISAKFKFGQNLSKEKLETILKELKSTNGNLELIFEIENYLKDKN